ncbi:hypothetical protein JW916_08535 [Candidatus Sumerlaeota bacterium]|nr:hypothetical protein [Candidatus Sumerlaeota bacterium]
MRAIVRVVLCFWVLAGLPGVGLAAPVGEESGAPPAPRESRTVDIPRVDRIVVDGDPSDWGERGFRVEVLSDLDGLARPPADFDPTFRLGWDDRGVLLLVSVRDNAAKEWETKIPAMHKSVGRRHDSLNLLIASDIGSRVRYQLFLSPGVDKDHPEVRENFYDLRPVEQRETPIEYERVRKTAGSSYIMEFLLPWPDIAVLAPNEKREKVAFQIDFVDADDADGPRIRPFWYPSERTYRDPMLMRVLRLVDKPSPPERISVRASGAPGGLPWVRVAAVAELTGQPVEVRRDGKTLARANLESRDGRAFAEMLLPPPRADGAYANLDVSVGGTLIDTVGFDETPKSGTLAIRFAPSPTSPETLSIGAGWETPFDKIHPDVQAQAHLYNLDGSVAAEASCPLGDRTDLVVPDGFYRAEARVKSFGGWTLEGSGPCLKGADPENLMREVVSRAREMQADPRYEAYAGWIDYLAGKIEERLSPQEWRLPEKTEDLALDLGLWLDKMKKDPSALAKERGVREWAYLSKVDGTGQPFTLSIPDDYDPKRPLPLLVWLHGRTGTHAGRGTLEIAEPFLGLKVLGRGKAAGYISLAEVDVLEAIDFVRAHWNVDPDRIYLAGSSMGGGGSFYIGSRHPDMFASVSPLCGYGIHTPVENLLNVPLRALHSSDDPAVAISLSRGAVFGLARFGGRASLDETVGYGHEVDEYTEGVERLQKWMADQRRQTNVERVFYRATDESARGAYWVSVEEWGPEGRPATVDARIGEANSLHLSLDNVAVARLDLARSPADRSREMSVAIDGRYREILPPPLPEVLFAVREEEGWRFSNERPAPPDFRLHFPGGARALYQGEPIMIVWGTQGDETLDQALHEIARVAQRSPGPFWPTDQDVRGGVPIDYTVYGRLPAKADTEVTADDIERCNLLLLGDARQNSVVARIAGRLPVHIDSSAKGKRVRTDDGQAWDFDDRAFGLLYYNPLAPKRLVYWVASDDVDFYRPDASLMRRQRWDIAPPDFMMMSQDGEKTVAARRFDSRWNWEKGYAESPLANAKLAPTQRWSRAWGEAMIEATGADLALVPERRPATDPDFATGETRQMDLATFEYDMRIAVMDITGEELVAALDAFEEHRRKVAERELKPGEAGESARREDTYRFVPEPSPGSIQKARSYRVALHPWTVGDYSDKVNGNPPSFRLTDQTTREAIERFLAGERPETEE